MANGNNGPIRVLPADDHCVARAGIRQFLETAGEIQVDVQESAVA